MSKVISTKFTTHIHLYFGLVDDTVVPWLDKPIAGGKSFGVTTPVGALSTTCLGSSSASSEISKKTKSTGGTRMYMYRKSLTYFPTVIAHSTSRLLSTQINICYISWAFPRKLISAPFHHSPWPNILHNYMSDNANVTENISNKMKYPIT